MAPCFEIRLSPSNAISSETLHNIVPSENTNSFYQVSRLTWSKGRPGIFQNASHHQKPLPEVARIVPRERQIEFFMGHARTINKNVEGFVTGTTNYHSRACLRSARAHQYLSQRSAISELECPLQCRLSQSAPFASIYLLRRPSRVTWMCCNRGKQKLPSLSTLIPKASRKSVPFISKAFMNVSGAHGFYQKISHPPLERS